MCSLKSALKRKSTRTNVYYVILSHTIAATPRAWCSAHYIIVELHACTYMVHMHIMEASSANRDHEVEEPPRTVCGCKNSCQGVGKCPCRTENLQRTELCSCGTIDIRRGGWTGLDCRSEYSRKNFLVRELGKKKTHIRWVF